MDIPDTTRSYPRPWLHISVGTVFGIALTVVLAAATVPVTALSWPEPHRSGSVVAAPDDITVAFGGDVHFERAGASRLQQNPVTALGPYAGAVLSRADLAIVNLETAVTDGGVAQPKEYLFRASPRAFTALRGAGVDVVTMANNHALDYGTAGMSDTLRAAAEASVPVVGIGMDLQQAYRPHVVTVKSRRVAFLGATAVLDEDVLADWMAGPRKPGVASAVRVDRLVRAVREAGRDADVVILYLHWGEERTTCPTPSQRRLADAVIAAGADVVVGAHAHRLQGGGWHRRGAYVDYGLGNFAFYAQGMRASTESGILTLTLSGSQVRGAEWAPARIRGGIPTAPSPVDAADITARKLAARECTDLSGSPANG